MLGCSSEVHRRLLIKMTFQKLKKALELVLHQHVCTTSLGRCKFSCSTGPSVKFAQDLWTMLLVSNPCDSVFGEQ